MARSVDGSITRILANYLSCASLPGARACTWFSSQFCWMLFAFWANFIELIHSWSDCYDGLRQIIKCIRELPSLKQVFRRCVSLQSRYGICTILLPWKASPLPPGANCPLLEFFLFLKWLTFAFYCLILSAWITVPSAESDLLICFASASRVSSTSLSSFSLPARSTKVNCETRLDCFSSCYLI